MDSKEQPLHQELEERRNTLRSSIENELTNPVYEKYCNQAGPLVLEQVDDEIVDVDALQAVIEKHGWPVEDDSGFYKSRGFELVNFHDELFSKDTKNKMVNFRARLKVPLIHKVSEANSPLEWYGLSPEVHRAYAVAPVLMNDIHGLFESFEHLPMFEAAAAIKAYFKDEQNDAALKAVYVAYTMMARLIRPEEGSPYDKDSHDALTH